jgi:hypothetical protein
MPPTDEVLDLHQEGDFSDVLYDEVAAAVAESGLDNLTLVRGDFRDTFPALAASGVRFGLAHIDCDVYAGVKYAQEAVWSRMAAGSYVVYDDALVSSCIGAMQAVEELVIGRRVHSEQVYPQLVFRVPDATAGQTPSMNGAGPPPGPQSLGPPSALSTPLRELADEVRSDLSEARKRPISGGQSWYPFDTLANLSHLETLGPLTRARLGELAGASVADIGAADGDVAFLLERFGCAVDLIDNAASNTNRLAGARTLRARLGSRMPIWDIDLDSGFILPRDYDFAFLLGVLSHLKSPYQALERLAGGVREMALSTRIAAWTGPKGDPSRVAIRDSPLAYLVPSGAANDDTTNYWTFSEAGLRALIERSGWEILEFGVAGAARSDPWTDGGDQRAFCYLRSLVFDPSR